MSNYTIINGVLLLGDNKVVVTLMQMLVKRSNFVIDIITKVDRSNLL